MVRVSLLLHSLGLLQIGLAAGASISRKETRQHEFVVDAAGDLVEDSSVHTPEHQTPTHPPVEVNLEGLDEVIQLSAVVINLKTRQDRLKKVNKWLDKVKIPHERLIATNPKLDGIRDEIVTKRYLADFNAQFEPDQRILAGQYLNFSGGERGCATSHVRAWERARERNLPTLILEDDALLNNMHRNTRNMYQEWILHLNKMMKSLPADRDIFYIRYSLPKNLRHNTTNETLANGIQRVHFAWELTGYILYPSGAQKLLENLPVDQPADVFVGKQIFEKKMNGYGSDVMMVRQTWGGGNIEESAVVIARAARKAARDRGVPLYAAEIAATKREHGDEEGAEEAEADGKRRQHELDMAMRRKNLPLEEYTTTTMNTNTTTTTPEVKKNFFAKHKIKIGVGVLVVGGAGVAVYMLRR